MRSVYAMVGSVASVAVVAAVLGGLATPVDAATEPTPTVTSTSSISVIIPETTSTPTPSPTPTPTRSGGSTPTPAPTTPATNPDGSPVPPAQPTENAPKLDLDKYSLAAHDWMVATGAKYAPGEKVQFVLYPGAIVIGSFVADETGTVVARFRIPDDTRPGDHVVEATGWSSKTVRNAQFVVTSAAAVTEVPWLWWVLGVLGVLVVALVALAIYFRQSIRGWFGDTVPAAGAAP